MGLMVLVAWQLVLDVVLCVVVTVLLLQRRTPRRVPAPAPPAWYGELAELAQDLMVATDRLLDGREARRAEAGAEAPPRGELAGPQRDPWTMVRTGLAPEEAARRGGLRPAELQLLRSVAAAAAATPTA